MKRASVTVEWCCMTALPIDVSQAGKVQRERRHPRVWELTWHDARRPIPEGWRLARQRYSHHHTRLYGAVLIERVVVA